MAVSFSSTLTRTNPPFSGLQKRFERHIGSYVVRQRYTAQDKCSLFGGLLCGPIQHFGVRYRVAYMGPCEQGDVSIPPRLQFSCRHCQLAFPLICNCGALVEVDTQVTTHLYLPGHSK